MSFDIRTLLVAVLLTTAFCAGARLLLWRMHPTIPGLSRWAMAGGAAVLTFVFILVYGKFHWQPASSLAQLFAVSGLILSWDGFRHFIGKAPLNRIVLAVIATVMLLWLVLIQVKSSVEVKAISNAVLVAVLSALIAYDLLISSKTNSPATRATGWVYALNAAVFMVRVIAAHEHPEVSDPLNPNGVTAFMLLWFLCTMIAITLGMVLMTSQRLQADLDKKANHDPLTGVLNRRSFSLLKEKAMAHARRSNQTLSALIIDLDKFKQINDQLGHHAGDVILCKFVAIAKKILREGDIFCRFGGEEFVVLLQNTAAKEALMVADRLRHSFATDSEITKNDESPEITISIGIAELKQDESFENLLQRADSALYAAKDDGRNCCKVAN